MASLGSNNFVLSLKVWIQKTDATSDKKIGNAVRCLSSFLLLADADSEGNTRMEGVLNIQQNADNTEVWYLLPFKDYRAVVLATFYSDGESIFKDVTDNYKNLNSATLLSIKLFKYLSNKKLPRILPCRRIHLS